MLRIPSRNKIDENWMLRAMELAKLGEGCVEPNPMVGCVIVADGGTGDVVGEGFHEAFGGPHAEVNALRAAGSAARGATVYVTLEPCCHHGKTPPCTDALIEAGVKEVIIAMRDPFPAVDGGGLQRLVEAGIAVEVGLCEEEAVALNAPYLKLIRKRRPWVIAKYAMTLDGKIATRMRSAKWISSPSSRARVHALRARVDAIMVGAGTVLQDDPLLNVRPEDFPEVSPAPSSPPRGMRRSEMPVADRLPVRVVVDSELETPVESRVVQTARQQATMLVVGPEILPHQLEEYRACGCEIFQAKSLTHPDQLTELLEELGRRRMTNLMVEGGGGIFGTLFDLQEIDELDVFIAPKIVGGKNAISPIHGIGIANMEHAMRLVGEELEILDGDIHYRARVMKSSKISPGE